MKKIIKVTYECERWFYDYLNLHFWKEYYINKIQELNPELIATELNWMEIILTFINYYSISTLNPLLMGLNYLCNCSDNYKSLLNNYETNIQELFIKMNSLININLNSLAEIVWVVWNQEWYLNAQQLNYYNQNITSLIKNQTNIIDSKYNAVNTLVKTFYECLNEIKRNSNFMNDLYLYTGNYDSWIFFVDERIYLVTHTDIINIEEIWRLTRLNWVGQNYLEIMVIYQEQANSFLKFMNMIGYNGKIRISRITYKITWEKYLLNLEKCWKSLRNKTITFSKKNDELYMTVNPSKLWIDLYKADYDSIIKLDNIMTQWIKSNYPKAFDIWL